METVDKILETDRLILRRFHLEDAEFIVELLNTPGWIKYIGNKNVTSLVEAREYLEDGPLKSYRENGFGLWMVELKFVSVPIGMCGLIKRDTLNDVDIGFAMLPEFAGLGYGHEAASETLEYGREKYGLRRVVAITVEYNVASIRLLEKLGLKFERKIRVPNDDGELLLYSVDF